MNKMFFIIFSSLTMLFVYAGCFTNGQLSCNFFLAAYFSVIPTIFLGVSLL